MVGFNKYLRKNKEKSENTIKLIFTKKVALWRRFTIEVEEKSAEETIKKIVNEIEEDDFNPEEYETYSDRGLLYETEEFIPMEENHQDASIEVTNTEDKIVYDNYNKEIRFLKKIENS